MAFTNTHGRYASFGIMTSLPEEIVDSFWHIIDNNLKGVFELRSVLKFEIINHKGKVTLRFTQKNFNTAIAFDLNYPFDPYFPRKVYIVDNDGKETIMLSDEYSLM
ncbi:DUF960 domain-containing protein [Streptococcus panodentis]|uniref:GTP cyclohydrolase n=1 Tax=Streptococcus panodentis TaxID=1581472 RepID=A0ABS5AY92_9STRE|nr:MULTISPECIES: DUF960 domain-containing protein [Streptococcus]KXT81487.1 hypothetical protein STRDD11_02039 [Streptococcus sp. DD11]MBP2621554.1 hypothetical protein [Streptococcus panodentis]